MSTDNDISVTLSAQGNIDDTFVLSGLDLSSPNCSPLISDNWPSIQSDWIISGGHDTMLSSAPLPSITLGELNGGIGSSYSRDLCVNGDAEFGGDVRIGGRSINETLDNIERRLAILRPNPELESRWERLRELGDQYRELEAELTSGEAVWATLKK